MRMFCALFSFSATSTSEMYTLSLHDALPIFNEGLDALGPAPTKRRAYTLGKLAEAYCQSGDVDRACDLGADAFTLATQFGDTESLIGLRNVRVQLMPVETTQAVRAFDDGVLST